jgi:ribosomal peptide maturation radical SAM protein 1
MIRLAETYGVARVHSVDNILDTRYIGSLFPELTRRNAGLDIFYEVKSNLRYDQLKTMRAGGVGTVQPGIESFSNATLELMRKGCTGLQNIQMLRWCAELGIVTAWNLLYGFPEELPAEYERMAELLPLLAHLPPPAFCCRIRLDRFSPLYTRAREPGVRNVRAMGAYSYVFPLPESALRELAYFFEFDYRDGRNPGDYVESLIERVEEWTRLAASKPARLDAYGTGDLLVIEDTRPCAARPQHIFTGLAARVYRECDTAARSATLARRLGADEADIRGVVQRFLDERLMVDMDGQVLSLAVFRDRETAAMPGEADALECAEFVTLRAG